MAKIKAGDVVRLTDDGKRYMRNSGYRGSGDNFVVVREGYGGFILRRITSKKALNCMWFEEHEVTVDPFLTAARKAVK